MFSILKELYSRRNLIRELVLANLKVRYSMPALGFLWTFLSPFLTAVILYVIFSVILRARIQEAPFIIYIMSAIFPWRFFSDSVMGSTTSLVGSKNLIREANVPHYLIPVSVVLTNVFIFLPSLIILTAICLFGLKGLPIFVFLLPFVLILHIIIAAGLSIMLSVFFVKWRDLPYIVELLLTLLFYMTPIFYSISLIRGSFPPLLFRFYACNPFVGMLNLYRVTLLKGFYPAIRQEAGLMSLVGAPVIFAVAAWILGFYFYKKNKNYINDYLSY